MRKTNSCHVFTRRWLLINKPFVSYGRVDQTKIEFPTFLYARADEAAYLDSVYHARTHTTWVFSRKICAFSMESTAISISWKLFPTTRTITVTYVLSIFMFENGLLSLNIHSYFTDNCSLLIKTTFQFHDGITCTIFPYVTLIHIH